MKLAPVAHILLHAVTDLSLGPSCGVTNCTSPGRVCTSNQFPENPSNFYHSFSPNRNSAQFLVSKKDLMWLHWSCSARSPRAQVWPKYRYMTVGFCVMHVWRRVLWLHRSSVLYDAVFFASSFLSVSSPLMSEALLLTLMSIYLN